MPTFDQNSKYLEATTNFRLALLWLSKHDLTVRRMQCKAEAVIEVEPNNIMDSQENDGTWHSSFIHGIRIIWRKGK